MWMDISEVIKRRYPNSTIVNLDIVDRGYPDTVEQDFLSYDTEQRFDNIITNPPYSLAKEFVEKGLSLLASGGKMAMFLKIQFLESQKRANLFRKYPLNISCFLPDVTWRNGEPFDEDGKSGQQQSATLGLFGRRIVNRTCCKVVKENKKF